MYGAIYGDLAGSIYEFSETKKIYPVYPEELITKKSFYSDDTILTMAILEAILYDEDYEKCVRKYIYKYESYKPKFKPYFKSSFSPNLIKWSKSNDTGFSRGNGAMMRISPVGFLFNSKDDILLNSILATVFSHNSTESIDSAITIATMIYYFRNGYSKEEVYKLMNLDVVYKPFTKFNTTCFETLGNCLYAFYISNDFEDAIRKTLMMGGDTDTNAAIVGSLAESFYGIDKEVKVIVKQKIPREFVSLLEMADSIIS